MDGLRQCDGVNLQALLIVRDDFWSMVSRFTKQLEIKVVEGENSAMVDLLDEPHAKKVLTWFGQAYGRLPEDGAEISEDQSRFLDQAIQALAERRKIVSVRLALFAEMVKDRPWSADTLNSSEGIQGLISRFFDEMFDSPDAPYEHRLHRNAIQKILRALLPPGDATIKGGSVAEEELLRLSGYDHSREQFDDVRRILDQETRLITPITNQPDNTTTGTSERRHYQLTHDYLVPALRDWLSRKQMQTIRGRAELRLAELSELWNRRPERRNLPSALEYASIALFTTRNQWTADDRKMMSAANRHVMLRSLLIFAAGVLVMVMAWTVSQGSQRRAAAVADRILEADIGRIQDLVQDLGTNRSAVNTRLRNALQSGTTAQRLRASLALLPDDPAQRDFLRGQIPRADASELAVICAALVDELPVYADELWQVVNDANSNPDHRFRTACALATIADPNDEGWDESNEFIGDELVNVVLRQPVQFDRWTELTSNIRAELAGPLLTIYQTAETSARAHAAAEILCKHAADTKTLVKLLEQVRDEDFLIVFNALKERSDAQQALQDSWHALDGSADSHRRANVAIALFKLGNANPVHGSLQFSAYPELRNVLIHRFSQTEIQPRELAQRLENADTTDERFALVLALGQYSDNAIQQRLIPLLLDWFEADPHAGIHSAVEWLLHSWGQSDQVKTIKQRLAGNPLKAGRNWMISSTGNTMIILGPTEFEMGSREGAARRFLSDDGHRRRIDRRFAICSTEVTVAQFRQFLLDERGKDLLAAYNHFTPHDDCPRTFVSWFLAVEFCNWLNRKENIPQSEWCYAPKKESEHEKMDGGYVYGMEIVPNFTGKTGYRLPTEPEWEFSARGGSKSSRPFGESDELLGYYAWTQANSEDVTHPVASLKPNDFGLFDVLGNVGEWTGATFRRYPSPDQIAADDPEFGIVTLTDERGNRVDRINRGGAFVMSARYLYVAARNPDVPTKFNGTLGFRVARTLP